jgi:hypothetical protein
MVLRGATSLRGALEGVGPESRDFFWTQKSRETIGSHVEVSKGTTQCTLHGNRTHATHISGSSGPVSEYPHADMLNNDHALKIFYVLETHIMYFIRPVDFLNVRKKGCWVGGGVLLVHNEILFWAQMALASLVPFQGPKKSRFSGPTPSNAPHNDVAPLKTIMYRAIKTTGTLIVILHHRTLF